MAILFEEVDTLKEVFPRTFFLFDVLQHTVGLLEVVGDDFECGLTDKMCTVHARKAGRDDHHVVLVLILELPLIGCETRVFLVFAQFFYLYRHVLPPPQRVDEKETLQKTVRLVIREKLADFGDENCPRNAA